MKSQKTVVFSRSKISSWIVKKAFAALLLSLPTSAAVPLQLHSLSDLDFGIAVQGDPPLTIPPGASENENNASFEVRGEPNHSYTILLPANPVPLTASSGASLLIRAFHSHPAPGPHGRLDMNGRQILYVGATREAISFHKPRGKYRGSFVITVIY